MLRIEPCFTVSTKGGCRYRKERVMGWISNRHMRQGGSLNRNPAKQRKGPLRKIVAVLRHSTGMFDPARVELECGHQVYSSGQFKARCDQCARSVDAKIEALPEDRRSRVLERYAELASDAQSSSP